MRKIILILSLFFVAPAYGQVLSALAVHPTPDTGTYLAGVENTAGTFHTYRWKLPKLLDYIGFNQALGLTGSISSGVITMGPASGLTGLVKVSAGSFVNAVSGTDYGTVNVVKVNSLTPLFTTSVAGVGTPTVTVSYAQMNAAAYSLYGNWGGTSGVPTFAPASLTAPMFGSQGSIHTLLHGSAGGNLSWGAVDLANDVTGNLGVASLNGGTGASNLVFWRGDGSWAAPFTLTSTGTSGTPTFSSGNLNIPHYTLAGLGGIGLGDLSATAPAAYSSGVFSVTYGSGISYTPAIGLTNDYYTGIAGGQTMTGGLNAGDQFIVRACAAVNTGNVTNSQIKFTGSTLNGSTAAQIFMHIAPTCNASSSAGYTALRVSMTETATGSGAKYLLAGYAGSAGTTQEFNIDNTGRPTFIPFTVNGGMLYTTAAGVVQQTAFTYPISAPTAGQIIYGDGTNIVAGEPWQKYSAASYTTSTTITSSDIRPIWYVITAQAGALLFNNPTGTFTDGQTLMIKIKDNGTARALTYGTNFRNSLTQTAPTTTATTGWLYEEWTYNLNDTKWDLQGYNQF